MKRKTKFPESAMMSYGYNPQWSEGSLKCPIFQTSTFVFNSAEEGKAFFEVAYGLREQGPEEKVGLIYSRINNPDLEILENRLCLWDGAEEGAVFESGMSAISTMLLEFLKPGDVLLHSDPVYGGTDHFIHHVLREFGIEEIGFHPDHDEDDIWRMLEDSGKKDRVKVIYIETPANPTNQLIDIEMCSRLAKRLSTADKKVITAVDNTYMGPLFQHPLKQGADLVLYSATKYIGGHSDVIAGACLGSSELIKRVKAMRTFLGSMAGPWTGWLLMRSLETLKVRMTQQAENAKEVAHFLNEFPCVNKVYYNGLLEPGSRAEAIYKNQCLGPGAMVSFEIKGGEKAAFAFLNNLKLIQLAVSLGGTESLAEHPATMTHIGVDDAMKQKMGISPGLIRLSIGVENIEDLIDDIREALQAVDCYAAQSAN
ncbi:MAG: cystathionine gamma-synthase family protein [Flavobacteriales bacterium]|nr:cystathionine gamma-synthase family protein [Flavobacteriales bacterium]